MPDKTVEEHFSPEEVTPKELKDITAGFLKLEWVQSMGLYVRVVKGLGLPPEPVDQTGMITNNQLGDRILSVPELMTRARGHAEQWEPLLQQMGAVAGGIQLYAETSVTTIQVLIEEQDTYASKTEKQKQLFKRDFIKAIGHLKAIAVEHKAKALAARDAVIAYSKDIERDHDMSRDIQGKYQKWLDAEQKQVEAWEKAQQVPHDQTGEAIMKRFENMVTDYHTKWAGLASGAGAATLGMVILPPFGTIAAFFAMTGLAVAAEEMRKLMVQFKAFLDQVQRFHAVKLFFNTLDGDFDKMRKVCAGAIQALGQVAGHWESIVLRLENVGGKANAIDPLTPSAPEEWAEPISRIARSGAEKAYAALIDDCKHFTQYMYVRDVMEVKIIATGAK